MIKTIMILISLLPLIGCGLIPEYRDLGPDLGFRAKNIAESAKIVCDRVTYYRSTDFGISLNQVPIHYLPWKTLKTGKADCLEFALTNLKILHDSGINGQLMVSMRHAFVKVNGIEYKPESHGEPVTDQDRSSTDWF